MNNACSHCPFADRPWNDAKRESIITFATLEQGLADMTNLLSWISSQMSDVTRHPHGTTLPPRA
jgi:hypothetical protein